MTGLSTPNLRQLPRAVKPLENETVNSYLIRVAKANCVDDKVLTRVITVADHPSGLTRLERLAVLTGRDQQSLHHALPELREDRRTFSTLRTATGRYGARPCRRCAAAHGVTDAKNANILLPLNHHICMRHKFWLGHGGWSDPRIDQVDIADCSDVLKAQVRLRRLDKRRGRKLVAYTFRQAERVMVEEDRDRGFTEFDERRAFDRRMRYFFDRENTDRLSDSYFSVARFPETVTLTTLMTSPFWRSLLANGSYKELVRLFQEFQRQNLISGIFPREIHVIRHWTSELRFEANQVFFDLRAHPRQWPGELGEWVRANTPDTW